MVRRSVTDSVTDVNFNQEIRGPDRCLLSNFRIMKEPETDQELEQAISDLGWDFEDYGPGEYGLKNRVTGSQTRLEAEYESDALFEAWNLVKW